MSSCYPIVRSPVSSLSYLCNYDTTFSLSILLPIFCPFLTYYILSLYFSTVLFFFLSQVLFIHTYVTDQLWCWFFFPFLFCYFQTWRRKEGDPWPRGRSYYVAACLGYGGQHQRVFISRVHGGDCVICGDIWLMDPQSGKMEEVRRSTERLAKLLQNYFINFADGGFRRKQEANTKIWS